MRVSLNFNPFVAGYRNDLLQPKEVKKTRLNVDTPRIKFGTINHFENYIREEWDRADAVKIDAANCSEVKMKELGKYFHKMPDSELEEATISDNPAIARKGLSRLTAAVNAVRKEREAMLREINDLSEIDTKSEDNIAAQKLRVTKEFLNYANQPDNNGTNAVINGITIYGASKYKDKFVNWLKEKSNMVYKEVEMDIQTPLKTLKELNDLATISGISYDHTNKRTLIHVKNLDTFLANKESSRAYKDIAIFKSFAQDLSKKYHATLLMTTDIPLDQFETASISTERMGGLLINLVRELTDDERNRISSFKQKISELDRYSIECASKWYITEGYNKYYNF